MHVRDDLTIAGRLTIRKHSAAGVLVEEVTAHNDITLAGRDLVARLFNKDNQLDRISRVSKIGLGRSQEPFNPRHKNLVEPFGETPIARVESTELVESSGRPRMLLRLVGELNEEACNGELREAGLFTDDNVMYNRVTFDTITKSKEFKLTLVWEILF